MAWGDNKESADDGSSWVFSPAPSSSVPQDENGSGVSAFSAEPTNNWGQRPLSNWGEEERADDPKPARRSIWASISRLFGAGRS